MLNFGPESGFDRLIVALLGLCAIGMGSRSILAGGDLSYSNWYGGLVFVLLAIIFEAFLVFAAVLKPQFLRASRKNR